jgi:hypothetical protein
MLEIDIDRLPDDEDGVDPAVAMENEKARFPQLLGRRTERAAHRLHTGRPLLKGVNPEYVLHGVIRGSFEQ